MRRVLLFLLMAFCLSAHAQDPYPRHSEKVYAAKRDTVYEDSCLTGLPIVALENPYFRSYYDGEMHYSYDDFAINVKDTTGYEVNILEEGNTVNVSLDRQLADSELYYVLRGINPDRISWENEQKSLKENVEKASAIDEPEIPESWKALARSLQKLNRQVKTLMMKHHIKEALDVVPHADRTATAAAASCGSRASGRGR